MLPKSATLQLTAAYVPFIWLPLCVAVTTDGHVCGLVGVRLMEREFPEIMPLKEPLLL
jgi:hypothetical protein